MAKAQSAIDFLNTYAFALLLIAIIMGLLVFFANVPTKAVPPSCNFAAQLNCKDALFGNTTTSNSELVILASDTQPGIINISSFNAVIDNIASESGVCVPDSVTAGESVYCIAYFGFRARAGVEYTGYFTMHANYCAYSIQNVSSGSCTSSPSDYQLRGSVTAQGAANAIQPTAAYVPITITNTEPVPAPAGFQQMITFQPSAYAQYERSDLGNIRFYYNGDELRSWCESNCASSSGSSWAVFWVKMPVAVPASTATHNSITIDMYFMPTFLGYDGVFAGEAPQLSSTYGQYDNGASVFGFYDNFAGSTLNPGWTVMGGSSAGTVTVSNGVTLSGGSSGWWGIENTYPVPEPSVIELYGETMTANGFGAGTYNGVGFIDRAGLTPTAWGIAQTSNGLVLGATFVDGGTSPALDTWYLIGGFYVSGSPVLYANYLEQVSTTYAFSSSYLVLNVYQGADAVYQWVRTRAYPPNGVMPSTTLGGVVQLT